MPSKTIKKQSTGLVLKPNTSLNNKTGVWRVAKPEIDYKACIRCGLCAKLCPEGCIAMTDKPQVDYNYCKGCGLCAHECPVKAIKMAADY
jgi:2-oxoacid:acceptor oxidoreductase delta subunit (pyruvate/2-ketoisovalerate family)